MKVTLGVSGEKRASKPSAGSNRRARVAISTSGSRKASPSREMSDAGMKGSSPWMLTTMSGVSPRFRIASRQRAVPLGQSVDVITARPPSPVTVSNMRRSSVATHTLLPRASEALRYTCQTIGSGPIISSGLPGSLVDENRAGMIPIVFILVFAYLYKINEKWVFGKKMFASECEKMYICQINF